VPLSEEPDHVLASAAGFAGDDGGTILTFPLSSGRQLRSAGRLDLHQ
jgi:hypothetical protein